MPDGTGIYRFTIVATGLPAGFRIHLRTHHQGATFPNGSRDLILTTADLDANGIATVEVLYPPGSEPRVCHTAQVVSESGSASSDSILFNIPPMNSVVITTEPALRVNDDHEHMDGTVEEWDKDVLPPIVGAENDLRLVKLKAINCRSDLYAYAEFTLVNPGSLSEKFWKDGKKAQAHTMAWSNIVEPGTEWEQEFYIEGVKASETVEDVIWLGSITEGLPDTKASTVYQLDVDVDSDNNGTVHDVLDDKLEESKDTDNPGVILVTQLDRDSDGDGMPDFADGLGLLAGTWAFMRSQSHTSLSPRAWVNTGRRASRSDGSRR